MTANPPSPARRAALLKLLEDWEAGRMTDRCNLVDITTVTELLALKQVAVNIGGYCLTPAGLSAARAIREKGE